MILFGSRSPPKPPIPDVFNERQYLLLCRFPSDIFFIFIPFRIRVERLFIGKYESFLLSTFFKGFNWEKAKKAFTFSTECATDGDSASNVQQNCGVSREINDEGAMTCYRSRLSGINKRSIDNFVDLKLLKYVYYPISLFFDTLSLIYFQKHYFVYLINKLLSWLVIFTLFRSYFNWLSLD